MFAWTRGCGAGRLLACLPMLISFACMSEKVPGGMCLPFPGRGTCLWRWSWAGPGLPGEPGSEPGWEFRRPHPAFLFLCPLGGLALLPVPPPLCSYPSTSESWLALTTGNSLASTQTQASACPSGSLSLVTQGPPGRAAEAASLGSPPSPSQMASLLIALRPPLAPDPCRPQLGQDIIWDMMEKPSFRP